eukprot:366749-Rhodomonas_salina.1
MAHRCIDVSLARLTRHGSRTAGRARPTSCRWRRATTPPSYAPSHFATALALPSPHCQTNL